MVSTSTPEGLPDFGTLVAGGPVPNAEKKPRMHYTKPGKIESYMLVVLRPTVGAPAEARLYHFEGEPAYSGLWDQIFNSDGERYAGVVLEYIGDRWGKEPIGLTACDPKLFPTTRGCRPGWICPRHRDSEWAESYLERVKERRALAETRITDV